MMVAQIAGGVLAFQMTKQPVEMVTMSQPLQIAQRKWLIRATTMPTRMEAGIRLQVVGKTSMPAWRGEAFLMARK
jgi:hypothetical protein